MIRRETDRHLAAFEYWYANGRSSRKTAEHVAVSERHVQRWSTELDWHARADARDQEAFKQAEREAINRRAKVLREQRLAGELMRRRGVEHLTEHKIKETRDAIAAITKGVELERSAEHLPSFIFDLMGLSDAELEAERLRLLRELPVSVGEPDPLGTGAAAGSEDEADSSE